MKKNSTKIKTTGANGYTLIEVVITMFITATVFVGVYALFAKAMNYDKEGQHEIIASELAQEGIEIIKNKKEKNEMDWAVWHGETVDGDIDQLSTFSGIDNLADSNPSLAWNLDGTDYDFGYSGSTILQYSKDTANFQAGCSGDCVGPEFTRKCTTDGINTNSVGNIDELRVTCVVTWKSDVLNGGERSVKASLVLTDWER